MPTAHDVPDGEHIAHLHINNISHSCLLDVVTLGRSMAGLEPLDRLGRHSSVLVRHVLKL